MSFGFVCGHRVKSTGVRMLFLLAKYRTSQEIIQQWRIFGVDLVFAVLLWENTRNQQLNSTRNATNDRHTHTHIRSNSLKLNPQTHTPNTYKTYTHSSINALVSTKHVLVFCVFIQ